MRGSVVALIIGEEAAHSASARGGVLVDLKATGGCHTDEFTRSGADPEGLLPVILGHEGAGIRVNHLGHG